MEKRLSKDEYYLNIAKAVSMRSTCIRRQFGAIIAKDDVIVSAGYNGPARGVINCMEVGCLKEKLDIPSYEGYDYCPGVHAEENAVINAARHGANILGGTMYLYGRNFINGSLTEGRPCDRCRRVLINAGIKELVTKKSDGAIAKKRVSDWIEEDTKNYLRKLKEVKEKSRV
jgi:dCMP deaminase